jgi:hypothetical protein
MCVRRDKSWRPGAFRTVLSGSSLLNLVTSLAGTLRYRSGRWPAPWPRRVARYRSGRPSAPCVRRGLASGHRPAPLHLQARPASTDDHDLPGDFAGALRTGPAASGGQQTAQAACSSSTGGSCQRSPLCSHTGSTACPWPRSWDGCTQDRGVSGHGLAGRPSEEGVEA